ncbi:MAG: cupin domain-containing protein [Desulfobacteraceae bacterium]|nr:cupin domain-containing protein [Desulfobacteraceae bacterium]
MIVRNFKQKQVQQGLYKAHGGADAAMLLTDRELKGMLFMAHADLKPSKRIEPHIDPYEEIYYILDGQGEMLVGNDTKEVKKGDAIFIPKGDVHALLNNDTKNKLSILVVASYTDA